MAAGSVGTPPLLRVPALAALILGAGVAAVAVLRDVDVAHVPLHYIMQYELYNLYCELYYIK